MIEFRCALSIVCASLLLVFVARAQTSGDSDRWGEKYAQTPAEMLALEYGFDPATAFDGIPEIGEPALYSFKWSVAYNMVSSISQLPEGDGWNWLHEAPVFAGDPTLGLPYCRNVCGNPRLKFEVEWAQAEASKALRIAPGPIVDADADPSAPATMNTEPQLKTRYASLQIPAAPVSQPSAPRFMACVSPGKDVGRGVWSWRATMSNLTDSPQPLDQGDIEQAANSVGIPSIGYGEAQNSNQLQINRSKAVVGTQIVEGGTGLGTVLIASRVIAATGVWGVAFAAATYAASKLVTYFKSVTPADLSTRFTGSKILVDGSSAPLAPRGMPNHSGTWEFFARYSGKKAVAQCGIGIY